MVSPHAGGIGVDVAANGVSRRTWLNLGLVFLVFSCACHMLAGFLVYTSGGAVELASQQDISRLLIEGRWRWEKDVEPSTTQLESDALRMLKADKGIKRKEVAPPRSSFPDQYRKRQRLCHAQAWTIRTELCFTFLTCAPVSASGHRARELSRPVNCLSLRLLTSLCCPFAASPFLAFFIHSVQNSATYLVILTCFLAEGNLGYRQSYLSARKIAPFFR